jgi:hypothetical protein
MECGVVNSGVTVPRIVGVFSKPNLQGFSEKPTHNRWYEKSPPTHFGTVTFWMLDTPAMVSDREAVAFK